MAGTPNYLSPEAARGEVADVRSDMYSLGVTLFELTFGRLPYDFSGTTLQEKLEAHVRQQPEFPAPWPHHIPEFWRDIIAKLLAKHPADRYPSYAALAADLRIVMPRTLVPAARLPRTLAWLFDVILLVLLQILAFVPSIVMNLMPGTDSSSFLAFMANVLSLSLAITLLLLGVYLQLRWSGTPGKQLFQLRIVDQHGLKPRRSILAIRFVLQFLPVCFGAGTPLLTVMLPLEWLDLTLSGLSVLWIMATGMTMLGSNETKSLHDRLLGTRVVVDTE